MVPSAPRHDAGAGDHPAPTEATAPTICGTVCNCGPNGEPIACGYAPHEPHTPHSWASLPTFFASPALTEEAVRAAMRERAPEANRRLAEMNAARLTAPMGAVLGAPPPPSPGGEDVGDEAKDTEPLRMRAYYYGFDETGQCIIDRVLSAVACAGKAFHHTEGWTDEFERDDFRGKTPVEWIQGAANDAAAAFSRLAADNARLTRELAASRASEAQADRYIHSVSAALAGDDDADYRDSLAKAARDLRQENASLRAQLSAASDRYARAVADADAQRERLVGERDEARAALADARREASPADVSPLLESIASFLDGWAVASEYRSEGRALAGRLRDALAAKGGA